MINIMKYININFPKINVSKYQSENQLNSDNMARDRLPLTLTKPATSANKFYGAFKLSMMAPIK